MDKEFLVDAVAQFLQSGDWLNTISEFLEANYNLFLTSPDELKEAKEHTLEQYDAFVAFKDLVERLLEKLIGDLGCTGDDLVLLLEQSLEQQASTSGERRFFIKTLLSFDDYDVFFTKISQYAAEQQANGRCEGNSEMSEWKLQEAIAKSILEAKSLGQIDEADEGLISWAEALINQCQAIQESAADSVDTDQNSSQEERMKQLEHTLIKERLKVDLLIAQRIASSNTQMKQQMLHIDATALEEPSDEYAVKSDNDELAALFTQIETIQTRLRDVKKQCFEFKSVGQPAMDTMYLFLKEKVHYQQDLVSQEKEISEFVFTQIQESDASVVPMLLEWLLLEAEGLRVQHQIQEQLDDGQAIMSTPDEGYWVQTWDEESQSCYYLHSVSGESVWEPPSCGYLDVNQQFQGPTLADDSSGSWDQAPAKEDIAVQEYTESYDPTYTSYYEQFDQVTTQLDAVCEQTESTDVNKLLEMESVLERISREHDEERKRLELVMQVEKARQKEELRKRKEKKRKERQAKKKTQTRDKEIEEIDQEKPITPRLNLSPRLPIVPTSPRMVELKADSKDSSEPAEVDHGLNIYVPGHGLVDLTHLLSDSHARRIHERKGTALPPMTLLNPASLRYLTEKMVKEQPNVWGLRTTKSEIVLEEVDSMNADEK